MRRECLFSAILILLVSGCGLEKEPAANSIDMETEETSVTAEDVSIEENSVIAEVSATEENQVTLCMVGDILLHTPVEEVSKSEDGSYDFHPIFSNFKDEISSYDIAVVNEEVIIGGEELGISGYPAFNSPYAIGDALVDSGFDVICHATNHVLDKGKQGVINTCSFWNENYPDITVLGINSTAEDEERVDIIEKNGIRIALLNYTYGTNGIAAPSDMPYAVDMLREDKVIRELDYAEKNADFTIVFPHWGTEYRLTPDDSQKKWVSIFEEHGADLVIGTHPHVIEPIEFVDDQMLVYYSLGNFVNWTSGTGDGVTARMVGGMAEVTIKKDKDGVTGVSDYGVKSLVCHVSDAHNGVTVYPLAEYPDELSKENAITTQDPSFSKAHCVEICNEVWGDLWD
ncbi:MAG: CapA family protein [Butyrivibrio sp.]|nr:CapA family protein [Butyrivibrio sp.]